MSGRNIQPISSQGQLSSLDEIRAYVLYGEILPLRCTLQERNLLHYVAYLLA